MAAKMLEIADFHLDLSRKWLTNKGIGRKLKPTSALILAVLIEHAGQIVSRKCLYKRVWGYDFDPGTKVIDVQLHYLRSILLGINSNHEIKTFRGKGICLQERPK